ncbi:Armadillo-type fold [Ostreococcus tauri]|uniref:Armadillo-type fold n=1 Tax=Ostreococcus tauri TaxID=70448 RepID=A0A096P9H0_OSTTA|nr:Armadillo-type fold [Ostreococcus tauri]CEG00637.1 Armadillo-type fold [Ostreococcus tauri]|eukprot:XP_022840494.1 Armadillo-type fold [Ostreococcus tauri]
MLHRPASVRSTSSLSGISTDSLDASYDPARLQSLVESFSRDENAHIDRGGTDALVVRTLRELACEAEGPAVSFTKTTRGSQLLSLISVVVRNVSLNDKVGALRALQLLRCNDSALQRLARAGTVPVLLRALSCEHDEEMRENAARALVALASSHEGCQVMVRGGAVAALSAACARAAREGGGVRDEAQYAADALERISGRNDAYDHRALFPISSEPSELDLVAESTAKSLVEVLCSEMTVVHVDASEALSQMASSGPTGRRAVARCATVLPLVTTALGGARQRIASMECLRCVAGIPSTTSESEDLVVRLSRDREELTMKEKVIAASGTASSLGGINFFHDMIDVLGSVLELRHSLEPAAADAALALWALAWQPSNRAHMVEPSYRIIERLTALAREGCSTSRDDVLSVLAVLALDDDGRDAIRAQVEGARLLDYLANTAEGGAHSPRGYAGSAGLSFDELIDRSRQRERSSTRLSIAVSRMGVDG